MAGACEPHRKVAADGTSAENANPHDMTAPSRGLIFGSRRRPAWHKPPCDGRDRLPAESDGSRGAATVIVRGLTTNNAERIADAGQPSFVDP